RDAELLREHPPLHVARREVIVIVQTDLAVCDAPWMAYGFRQRRRDIGCVFHRIMRMNPEGPKHALVPQEFQGGSDRLRIAGDRQARAEPGREEAITQIGKVRRPRLLENLVEMTVRIDVRDHDQEVSYRRAADRVDGTGSRRRAECRWRWSVQTRTGNERA